MQRYFSEMNKLEDFAEASIGRGGAGSDSQTCSTGPIFTLFKLVGQEKKDRKEIKVSASTMKG